MEREESQMAGQTPVFKVLIFTDNHVGYKEKHPIRGKACSD